MLDALGVRWKALSTEDKAPYDELALADKTRFKEQMAVYNEKKAVAAALEGDIIHQNTASTKKKSAVKKDKSVTKKKKVATSAYVYFRRAMRSTVEEENPVLTSSEVLKELGTCFNLTQQP